MGLLGPLSGKRIETGWHTNRSELRQSAKYQSLLENRAAYLATLIGRSTCRLGQECCPLDSVLRWRRNRARTERTTTDYGQPFNLPRRRRTSFDGLSAGCRSSEQEVPNNRRSTGSSTIEDNRLTPAKSFRQRSWAWECWRLRVHRTAWYPSSSESLFCMPGESEAYSGRREPTLIRWRRW
jgi:hypothetical protein